MPQKHQRFGKFGARGEKGGTLVARQLDRLVDTVASPIGSRRGLAARLNYLTRTPHALAAARAAGLTATDRTLKGWLSGTRRPTAANLKRIEAAYLTVRRRNVAGHLTRRLNAAGGTTIEIHPVNERLVPRRNQRPYRHRTMNVYRWDKIVGSWAAGDRIGLDTLWNDLIGGLGSDWGQYEYAENVGFAD